MARLRHRWLAGSVLVAAASTAIVLTAVLAQTSVGPVRTRSSAAGHVQSQRGRVRAVAVRPAAHSYWVAAAVERVLRRGRPLFCGANRARIVGLTFDDGPGVYTHLAIRILRRAKDRATFFVVGRNLAVWPRLILSEQSVGEVGDHTWTHSFLPALAAPAIRAELRRTQRAIEQTGQRVLLFRPPYGARNAIVEATARSLKMIEVLWSVDSLDWKGADWRQIAANVLNNVRPGSIVLMHENRGQTIRALKYLILPGLRTRHFVTVTVQQLLTQDPPTTAQLERGPNGCLSPPRQAARVGSPVLRIKNP